MNINQYIIYLEGIIPALTQELELCRAIAKKADMDPEYKKAMERPDLFYVSLYKGHKKVAGSFVQSEAEVSGYVMVTSTFSGITGGRVICVRENFDRVFSVNRVETGMYMSEMSEEI